MAHTPAAATDPHHQPDGHGGDQGNQDNAHGGAHDAPALGPIDRMAWGSAIVGIALGLVVFLAFIQALR